jgi:hypothetical protein
LSLPRLLIDENLSVVLPPIAHARGFECAHVVRHGYHAWKDWRLMEEVAAHDWVLVTNNAVEYRGRYRKIDIHPGIVFILPNLPRMDQIELFSPALDDIEAQPVLINLALDVQYDARGGILVERYALP